MSNEDLAERRGKVDATINKQQKKLKKHDDRLTRLEKFMYMTLGGLLFLSVAVGSSELTSLVGAI